MSDELCDVEKGMHSAVFWRCKNTNIVVCSHHRLKYEEQEDKFGPFDWELLDESE